MKNVNNIIARGVDMSSASAMLVWILVSHCLVFCM